MGGSGGLGWRRGLVGCLWWKWESGGNGRVVGREGGLLCEWPVGLGEGVDYLGAGGGEEVVGCICGCDDAFSAFGGSGAGLPG